MSFLIGDNGKSIHGTFKTFNITMATPKEVSLGTLTLPNAEGSTNQVSFTIQQSDLPTFSMSPYGTKYGACIVTSGKSGATFTTVNYKVFKNGSPLTTANTTHTANQYWTQTHWRWLDVLVGDTLEVRHWANVSDANLDYCALVVYPTQLFLANPNILLKDIEISNIHNLVTLTGNGLRPLNITNTSQIGFQVSSNTTQSGALLLNTSTALTIYSAMQHQTMGFMRTNWLDLNGLATSGVSHATNISYQRNTIPSQITFREMLR